MKNINLIKKLVLITLMISTLSCVNDDEITIAPYPREALFTENFDAAVNNTNLDLPGWTNFSESGSKVWREKTFQSNGYADFSAYQSNEASNIGWLVTPKITAKGYDEYLFTFNCAKYFLDEDSINNTITAYYSTNYNGTNVASATWTKIEPLNIPKKSATNYVFASSKFKFTTSSEIYFAFKYVGNGLANSTLDGGFQIDNVNVYGLR